MANLSPDEVAELRAFLAQVPRIQLLVAKTAPDTDGGPSSVEEVAALMREACDANGYRIEFDDSVDTKGAAFLLGLAPSTLKNDRSYGERFPYRSQGKKRYYSITDLARIRIARGEKR